MEFSCQDQGVACHNKKAVRDINCHCQRANVKKCDPRWKFADILDDLFVVKEVKKKQERDESCIFG